LVNKLCRRRTSYKRFIGDISRSSDIYITVQTGKVRQTISRKKNIHFLSSKIFISKASITLPIYGQSVGQSINNNGGDQGDAYYELLSALHKSVRGSSPDGALYWYARILQGGGDPLIVARRILAIASEDIGNADPRAMQLALNAWDTFTRVGPAEGERAIAQALIFCAMAPKSNAVYSAFNQAKKLAEQYPDLPVPKHQIGRAHV